METPKQPPLEFANRVICRLLENQGKPAPSKEGYRVIRVVFRSLGGQWEGLFHGNMVQTRLLSKVVTNWAAQQAKAPGAQ